MVEQRFTFDAIAADYDARRPGYPDALFEDLFAGTLPDARVLEIGCGTGKATDGLARTGRAITALDPGPAMLAQARRRLAGYPNVRFVESTFEGWTAEGEGFHLICAAQAWHWVDPAIGFRKAADLLAPGGRLAIFGNVQSPLPEPMGSAVGDILDATYGRRLADARDAYVPDGWIARSFAACGMFEVQQALAYERSIRQTTADFVGVVETFSDTRMLAEPAREAFLQALRGAIDAHGGVFEATLETYCFIGRLRS